MGDDTQMASLTTGKKPGSGCEGLQEKLDEACRARSRLDI
jgi:hypothetical protein